MFTVGVRFVRARGLAHLGWYRCLWWLGVQRDLLDLLDPSEWVPGVSLFLGLVLYLLLLCQLYLRELEVRAPGGGVLYWLAGLVVKVVGLGFSHLQGILYLEWALLR